MVELDNEPRTEFNSPKVSAHNDLSASGTTERSARHWFRPGLTSVVFKNAHVSGQKEAEYQALATCDLAVFPSRRTASRYGSRKIATRRNIACTCCCLLSVVLARQQKNTRRSPQGAHVALAVYAADA